MADLDPALTVPCPLCRAGKGEFCRSRHAVAVHAARRQQLASLSAQADQLLRKSPSAKPARKRRRPKRRQRS
jgi:hypothetical protein